MPRKSRLPAVIVAIVWLAACAALADEPETFTGRCVKVADGDTITVLRGEEPISVRLEGIDAPERGRDFSRKAKSHLASLVLKQDVTVRVKELDRYGRTVGRVFVHGVDTSLDMVESGLAWHFVKYSDDETLAAAELAARAAGVGLWSLHDPSPPWVVRARPDRSEARAEGDVTYHGNRRSKVFHGPWCHHYNCKNCTVVFETREAAVAAGFRPDGQCDR